MQQAVRSYPEQVQRPQEVRTAVVQELVVLVAHTVAAQVLAAQAERIAVVQVQ